MTDLPDEVDAVLDALDVIAENLARERWDGKLPRPPQCCPECGHHYICHALGGRSPCTAGRYLGDRKRTPCSCTVTREAIARQFAEWLVDTRPEDSARVLAEAAGPRPRPHRRSR